MPLLFSKPSGISFCFYKSFTVYVFIQFVYRVSLSFYFPSYILPSSSPLALFQHVHLFYKAHDCPFHENQEPWRGRAPVFKSCLASGRQSPPGRLPALSAVVEGAIWTMERSVFPISRRFPLPCNPTHPCPAAWPPPLPLGLLQIGSTSLHTS